MPMWSLWQPTTTSSATPPHSQRSRAMQALIASSWTLGTAGEPAKFSLTPASWPRWGQLKHERKSLPYARA